MTTGLESGMRIVKVASAGEAAFAVVDAADDSTPRRARAWASLRQAAPDLWLLTGLVTKAGFERRGYGRALVETVRAWAGQHGHTVRTVGAMPDVYGFYEKTGCRMVMVGDEEEYLVAPV